MKILFASISFLILFGSFSCKDATVNAGPAVLGKVIFETERVNFAWGYVRYGKFFAENGAVYSYDLGKENIPWEEHSDGYYTREELTAKYLHDDTLRGYIANDSVEWSYHLAVQVTTDTYSDTVSMGADMGELTYAVYLFDKEKMKYKKIVLSEDGDWKFFNTSQHAIEITRWLERN